MRSKDVLIDDLENVKIFYQYLYISEDHSVVVKNSIGVPLEIRMNEKLELIQKNLNFPDVPAGIITPGLGVILGIIDQLNDNPPKEIMSFKSRWEEIKMITQSNVVLNKGV